MRQLGEVETLQVEANLQGLAGALNLVRDGHVCHRGGEGRGDSEGKAFLNIIDFISATEEDVMMLLH